LGECFWNPGSFLQTDIFFLNTESEHCLALWMNDGFVRIPASAMRRGASILLEKKQSIGEEGVEEGGEREKDI